MNGANIKELLVTNDVDLNKTKYFETHQDYALDDIPIVLISKKIIQTKLINKYGETVGNYIISQIYKEDDNEVDPKEILKLQELKIE